MHVRPGGMVADKTDALTVVGSITFADIVDTHPEAMPGPRIAIADKATLTEPAEFSACTSPRGSAGDGPAARPRLN